MFFILLKGGGYENFHDCLCWHRIAIFIRSYWHNFRFDHQPLPLLASTTQKTIGLSMVFFFVITQGAQSNTLCLSDIRNLAN